MYYWVAGYSQGGQQNIAGPYQDRATADTETQGWFQKGIYELNTPDRNQAIIAINNKRAQSPPKAQSVKVRDVTVDEEEDDDDSEFDLLGDDDDEDEDE